MENEIKNITIGTYSGYFADESREDDLTISKNEISYHLKIFNRCGGINEFTHEIAEEMEKELSWRYERLFSMEYHRLFDELVKALESYVQPEQYEVLDAGGIAIHVKYENGEERILHYHFDSVFYDDKGIQYILSIMKKMLPKEENLPSLFRRKFKL